MKPHLFFFSLLFFLLAATTPFASLQTEDFSRIHVGAKNLILPDFIGTKTPESRSTCRVWTVYLRKHTSDPGVPAENGLNWTGYVGEDPINMVDPTGYYTFENGEVEEEKAWASRETPYSPFTIENQCVEISPNWRKAKEQIAILKQIQSDLINKIDRLSEKDPIGLLYRETASPTERRRKEYILTELRSLLDSKSKRVYVKPSLFDRLHEGRHNFFTGNITIHTSDTNNLKRRLLHESMHNLDSFNLFSSSYDKSGLLRELKETYITRDEEGNLFKEGLLAPQNADTAAVWLMYILK